MAGKAGTTGLAGSLPALLGGVDEMRELKAAQKTVDQTRADLARILINLTADVEKFDSLIRDQRRLLEQGGLEGPAFGNDQVDAEWEQLSLEADELVSCARQTLDRLRQMWDATAPLPKRSLQGGASGLARDRQAGPRRLGGRPSRRT